MVVQSAMEGHPLYQGGRGPELWEDPKLLPSPNARDYKGPRKPESAALHPGPLLPEVFDGGRTRRPSDDGSTPSVA